VIALYDHAGLSLQADLDKLEATARIPAKPAAVDYLEKYIVFNGDIEQPVLTMHTTGDGLVLNQDEQAYASVVRSAGNASLLRETFVHRAGHCSFTPAETITAFNTLIQRLNKGHWDDSNHPSTLNTTAAALGPAYNTLGAGTHVGPSFIEFTPTVFLRRFDARNLE